MTAPNPYAAPQAAFAPQVPGAPQGLLAGSYVPLGWRTALAAVSVLGLTVADGVMRALQMTMGDSLTSGARGGTPDITALALIGFAGLGVLVMSVCSWVFIPVWFHRASSNLRGLGRYGMAFTPAGCAGWFFVPIANLWKPVQAMAEIWRASDPEADQGSWFASSLSPLIGVWWGTYLLSGAVSSVAFFAKDDPSSGATIGLVSNVFRAAAAVALIVVMRGVSSRQEQAASRLAGG
jgi:hypothetical protein